VQLCIQYFFLLTSLFEVSCSQVERCPGCWIISPTWHSSRGRDISSARLSSIWDGCSKNTWTRMQTFSTDWSTTRSYLWRKPRRSGRNELLGSETIWSSTTSWRSRNLRSAWQRSRLRSRLTITGCLSGNKSRCIALWYNWSIRFSLSHARAFTLWPLVFFLQFFICNNLTAMQYTARKNLFKRKRMR